jgi:hypothetical protein
VTFGGAAHRFRENVDLQRLLTAVRLRQSAHPDEGVGLDIGEGSALEPTHHGVIGDLDLVGHLVVARLDRE